MKKWINWFCATTIALIAVLAVSTLSSCNRRDYSKHRMSEYVDSTDLVKTLDQIDNPTFTSVDDALSYYADEKEYRSKDSLFFTLSPDVISNVYSVLEKRHITPTKMAIVSEYLDNIHVYSNLPDRHTEMSKCLDSIDIPNTKVVDTIIGGKHFQVLQEQTTNIQ